ncbi:MAG: hypothetical protein AB1446_01665, partial [Bacillota bacterium]
PVELMKSYGGLGQFEDVFDSPSSLWKEIEQQYEHLMRKSEGVASGVVRCYSSTASAALGEMGMPRRVPRLVVEDGKATAVILDIEVYREMLERLEDLEDLRMLEEVRKRPLDLQSLEDFLAGRASDV